MPDSRRGVVFGALAYTLWGTFPLYWTLLEPAGAIEILAHRIVWSVLTMLVILVLARRVGHFRALLRDRQRLLLLVCAALVISVNWGAYIWGVNNDRVVETSLGYFINPLVTVLMGVLLLGERLRRLQWIAMAIALLAVVVLTVDYGEPPWVALLLAFSFGTYGLLKKQAGAGAVESITLETLVIAPFAAAYVAWLVAAGQSTFGGHGVGHALLFTTTGVITAIPLMLFGAAANRVSMVSLGLLQYLAPTLQFALGILVFREDMPASRWIGFGLVWVALAIFTVEAIKHHRRQLRLAAEASAV
ncbi:EamA family transporter RarD [Nocardioides sp. zg-1228]|uniref:EamA family transporter RarD n=1 Tax=Nocardioides sp. zg-1228 TaxID=2763008 RepID=UPI00164289A2|nr:EamA family transporter RarD [Nocardioides sp. zg-1228]MBC2932705.1 EamA family transporter RarD [Nocardioides sp. zg-1228]QSF58184.1 EamA family transporter RarD [Nocardioides sp. zg-1228]